MTQFIDQHKHEFGVEPICRTLQVAPSSYHAAKTRTQSARSISDDARTVEVEVERFIRAITASTAPGRCMRNSTERVIRSHTAPSNG